MTAPICLFLPFYTPRDAVRAKELLHCLKANLNSPHFDRIVLLQDDDTVLSFDDPRLTVIRLPARPTYLDWVRHSRQICPNGISVLANSDIYFDDTVVKLRDLFELDPGGFMALSRHDKTGAALVPHPNPHWSQDAWAFCPAADISAPMQHQIDIPLGVPRCDNKIAYLFSINGFTVYNPMAQIRSVHVHETDLRYYDKTGDTSIKGGVAMVHASPDLQTPAQLDIEIWSQKSDQYNSPRINPTLERWAKERRQAREDLTGLYGYDHDWQYPAITEEHAFRRMQRFLAGRTAPSEEGVYFGFPWATLIDLTTHAGSQTARIAALEGVLESYAERLRGHKRVVTVCQHIRMCEQPDFFIRAGITDIYWSHCRSDRRDLPELPGIRIHPFPLYPVQQVPVDETALDRDRSHLFSFVGARSTDIYMTQSRKWILDALQDHPKGKIIDRDSWHYNKVVYNRQILKNTKDGSALVDQSASDQFRRIMDDTVFSLCPSGTGPNSIRLWEAVLNNSIPVVLSDLYQPPGDPWLWDLATVSCAETPEAVRDLPDRLSAIAGDPERLHRKRVALFLLAQKYGPDRFVHDIVDLLRWEA